MQSHTDFYRDKNTYKQFLGCIVFYSLRVHYTKFDKNNKTVQERMNIKLQMEYVKCYIEKKLNTLNIFQVPLP